MKIAPKKRNRVRTREFSFYTTSAGPQDREAIMRDMHPDEPYELLAVGLTAVSKLGDGIVGYIALARNTSGVEPVISEDELVSKAGVFLHWEPDSEKVAGDKSKMSTDYRRYDPPIKFDENDKMNMHVYSGGANILTFVFDIIYRLL